VRYTPALDKKLPPLPARSLSEAYTVDSLTSYIDVELDLGFNNIDAVGGQWNTFTAKPDDSPNRLSTSTRSSGALPSFYHTEPGTHSAGGSHYSYSPSSPLPPLNGADGSRNGHNPSSQAMMKQSSRSQLSPMKSNALSIQTPRIPRNASQHAVVFPPSRSSKR